MKYTFALFCLILTIIINTSSIQAYPLETFSISSYEIAEATPVKKGVEKSKKRASKLKKKKFSKKGKLKPKLSNKKKRLIYTLLIIGGFILAILSIVLIVLLAPIVGVPVTGVGMGLAKYFGVFGIVICSLGALFLIWLGFVFLNNTPKGEIPLTPTEQLAEKSAKKYPNIPAQKIEEYAELSNEIIQLEKENEVLEREDSEAAKDLLRRQEEELEIKKQKQAFVEELNEELEAVANEKRMEYIFLKEENFILKQKKELYKGSSNEDDKSKVERLDARIKGNIAKLKILKK